MAELTQQIIEDWIESLRASGQTHFSAQDAWNDIGITLPENRTHLRVILSRCKEKRQIDKSTSNGHYRILDTTKLIMDWENADVKNVLPILWPFGIQKWAKIHPKSIIIVAGEKNAGKTAFLYQCIKMNYASFNIELFNSETGMEQMKERFMSLEFPSPAPFKVFERYDNFSDVVDPDALTIIDYLDFNSEVYRCGEEIDRIFQKLKTGACIIGMQKPPGRDLAVGGIFSEKRAVLYISLGDKICKLKRVKNPAGKGVNPENKQWGYSFDNDGFFTNIVGLEER